MDTIQLLQRKTKNREVWHSLKYSIRMCGPMPHPMAGMVGVGRVGRWLAAVSTIGWLRKEGEGEVSVVIKNSVHLYISSRRVICMQAWTVEHKPTSLPEVVSTPADSTRPLANARDDSSSSQRCRKHSVGMINWRYINESNANRPFRLSTYQSVADHRRESVILLP
jgi:hypothetical protein